MDSYSLTRATPTIFELGTWAIKAVDRGEYAFIEIDSFITHRCDAMHATSKAWEVEALIIVEEKNLGKTCTYCGEGIPDEIQALWRLQNMENL